MPFVQVGTYPTRNFATLGPLYTENLNSKDFTDNNTVIYGHNMKNDSMPVKQ